MSSENINLTNPNMKQSLFYINFFSRNIAYLTFNFNKFFSESFTHFAKAMFYINQKYGEEEKNKPPPSPKKRRAKKRNVNKNALMLNNNNEFNDSSDDDETEDDSEEEEEEEDESDDEYDGEDSDEDTEDSEDYNNNNKNNNINNNDDLILEFFKNINARDGWSQSGLNRSQKFFLNNQDQDHFNLNNYNNYKNKNLNNDKATSLTDGEEGVDQRMDKTSEASEIKIPNFQTIFLVAKSLLPNPPMDFDGNPVNFESVFELLNLFGRIKSLSEMMSNFFDLLKTFLKTNPDKKDKLDDVKYYLDHCINFTSRTYNCNLFKYPSTQLPPEFHLMQIRFINWPLAVKTAIYCSSQFLKDSMDMLGLGERKPPLKECLDHLGLGELHTMKNIYNSFSNAFDNLLSKTTKTKDESSQYLSDLDPGLIPFTQPISMDSLLLNFPQFLENKLELIKGPKQRRRGKR